MPLSLQFKVAGDIIKQDGFFSLYKGLGAGLLRQATYTTARLGIFNTLSEELKKRNEGKVKQLYLQHPIKPSQFIMPHPTLTATFKLAAYAVLAMLI